MSNHSQEFETKYIRVIFSHKEMWKGTIIFQRKQLHIEDKLKTHKYTYVNPLTYTYKCLPNGSPIFVKYEQTIQRYMTECLALKVVWDISSLLIN